RTFARKGSAMKAIIFMSCADSVDFHHKALIRADASSEKGTAEDDSDSGIDVNNSSLSNKKDDMMLPAPSISNPANPVTAYRLHGSLPQADRTRITQAFSKSTNASLLIATDVASRGLDVPNLDLVIEYDPAFSKEDHLHRIGRTARLGKDGRAIIFLSPGGEEGYINVLKSSYKTTDTNTTGNVTGMTVDDVLQKGFSPATGTVASKKEIEVAATEFQLAIERWVVADPKVREMAGKAFMSHVRAYATHIASERKWFDIKGLHLGHLAKAFGLRDPPAKVNVQGLRGAKAIAKGGNDRRRIVASSSEGAKQVGKVGERVLRADVNVDVAEERQKRKAADVDETVDAEVSAAKMKALTRNRRLMMGAGADEFNLA
ncbi:ATP-dependent RNA helicase dbp7, partial [Elasticomyces elasticus]